MKNISILSILILQFSLAFAQEPDFKNQGESETNQAVKFFKTEYKDSLYQKFHGSITVVDSNTVKFEKKALIVWGTKADLLAIFKEGIFYPQLILGNEENLATKTKEEISALNNKELFRYNISRNDSLQISNFEELEIVAQSPQQKRFRFWVYQPGLANPQVYFLELKNSDADEKTDLKTFIKGAKLTFLKSAWMVI